MAEPKGYALLIGIDEFKEWVNGFGRHWLDDVSATKDIDFWKVVFKEWYHYSDVIEIKNEDATLSNVILSFYYLALRAQEGDAVTISFSTHALFDMEKGSSLCLYENESYLSDEVLYFLLRLFKKNVRISLILDICQSEGFVSERPLILDATAEKQIEDAFADQWIWEKWLKDIIVAMTDVEIVASVAVLATASRDLDAPDGFIKLYANMVLTQDYRYYNWWGYTFEEFRDKLEEKLELHYKQIADRWVRWIDRVLRNRYQPIHLYLERLPQSIYDYDVASVEFVQILGDLLLFATSDFDHGRLEYWINFWMLAFERCPHLHWRGVESKEFKEQAVFSVDPSWKG